MDQLLGRQTARDEARALYWMLLRGMESVQELRELIAVGPKIERVLRAFADANPHEAHWIESSLKFRSAVLEEFNRVVRDGVPDAEPQKTESDSFKDAVSLYCQNLRTNEAHPLGWVYSLEKRFARFMGRQALLGLGFPFFMGATFCEMTSACPLKEN